MTFLIFNEKYNSNEITLTHTEGHPSFCQVKQWNIEKQKEKEIGYKHSDFPSKWRVNHYHCWKRNTRVIIGQCKKTCSNHKHSNKCETGPHTNRCTEAVFIVNHFIVNS